MQTVLQITKLRKVLGDDHNGFELRVPHLEIRRGSFVAVTGKSGSGKSTLLDVLALISAPTDGEVFRLHPSAKSEQDVDLLAMWGRSDERTISNVRRRLMGYVLQTGALFNYLNVQDNISLPLLMAGHKNDSEVKDYVGKMLARFSMTQSAKQDVRSLSGGERQRVAILRAIIHRPALIFCDEPTAALDFEMAQTVLKQLRDLAHHFGTTIIMVTHDRELVAPFATQRIEFTNVSEATTGQKRVFKAAEVTA